MTRPWREDLQARDYALAESTRAMGMDLSDLRVPRPAITLAAPRWSEYLRILGVPPGFARRADRDLFHVLIAAPDGVGVAAAMAEGIYAALGFRDLGRILEYVPPGDG